MPLEHIQGRIFSFRGVQVMVDRDLAMLYEVETRALNQAVKRNLERFPEEFMFQLSPDEFENWKSQIVISNADIMGLRRAPFVFTEQGVSMLSAVLKSPTAVIVSIEIIKVFVKMRQFIASNGLVFQKIAKIEEVLSKHDSHFEKVFQALEGAEIPKQGVFYDGQIFDAYVFVNDLLRQAKSSIVLIDNYIDDSVLLQLTKRRKGVSATILTKAISERLRQDLRKHNAQYPEIQALEFPLSHDRFLILDGHSVYHIGASLKDLGKKWFAFSKLDKSALSIMDRVQTIVKECKA